MEEFKQALFHKKKEIYKRMNLIQSKDYILYTNEVKKIELIEADDKRHLKIYLPNFTEELFIV